MNNELSLLGLAMRAGKVLSGDELVLKAIRSQEATLVVLAGDASDNTQKKFRDKCGSYSIPLLSGMTVISSAQVLVEMDESCWL